jgi:nitrite reductase (NADH) small subunit
MIPMSATLSQINLGSIEKIPLGQGRCFQFAGEEVAVFRQRDGKLFATQNRCPHRQGPLSEGVMGAGKVICPLHAHKFDLATGQGSEPGECVKTYFVSEANGEILLQVCS